MKKGNPSQNQKSCKAYTQANAFAAHLLLPNRTKYPTTLTFDTNFYDFR